MVDMETARQLAALLSAGPLAGPARARRSGAVIGEHPVDRAPVARGRSSVVLLEVPDQRDQRLPQRPPAAARPGRGSAPSVARNASRLAAENSVQAMTTSQAGSPTPEVPKSITAASRPSRSSRLPVATSPWNQTGSPLPARRHRVLPHPQRGVAGDLAAERVDRADGLVRVGRERAAAEEVVAAGRRARRWRRRPAARRGSPPGPRELRQVARSPARSRSRPSSQR